MGSASLELFVGLVSSGQVAFMPRVYTPMQETEMRPSISILLQSVGMTCL
jgi:hypothetical protein